MVQEQLSVNDGSALIDILVIAGLSYYVSFHNLGALTVGEITDSDNGDHANELGILEI